MLNYSSKISAYPAPIRLGIFILLLLLIWLPLAAPIFLFLKQQDPNLASIIVTILLYLEFLVLIIFWGKTIHQATQPLKQYGLVKSKNNARDFIKGLGIGFGFCWGLFVLEAILGWVNFSEPSIKLFNVIIAGFITALAVSLAEELLFRGWLLDELQRDYQPKIAIWVSAIIFAVCHFLKPIEEIIRTFPTFPALVLLGLILALNKISHNNNLGICIGIHGGLIWAFYIINVGELVEYSERVSPLITGIDRNPIAGVMGLLFLGIMAILTGRKEMKIKN